MSVSKYSGTVLKNIAVEQAGKPERDGSLLAIAIVSCAGSLLACLAGLACTILFVLSILAPATGASEAQERFATMVEMFAFGTAGLIGGGWSLYHGVRACGRQRPSSPCRLPHYAFFLLPYGGVLAVGAVLSITGKAMAYSALTIVLIVLAGTLPGLTLLSFSLRRIGVHDGEQWPLTWRRVVPALASGATLAVLLSMILELLLTVALAHSLGITQFSTLLADSDQPILADSKTVAFLLMQSALIAPLVEEIVKPLAVVVLLGRVRSTVEAFMLGMACGIGFDLVESTGYIGTAYTHWMEVALQRGAGVLLHSFGAGLMALGCYFLTHPHSSRRINRVLMAGACWGYALLQHALWNGSFGLQLLPAPLGPFLGGGNVPLGPLAIPAVVLIYIPQLLLMLTGFLWVTSKLRAQPSQALPSAISQSPQ